jgi:hypothetical protein
MKFGKIEGDTDRDLDYKVIINPDGVHSMNVGGYDYYKSIISFKIIG